MPTPLRRLARLTLVIAVGFTIIGRSTGSVSAASLPAFDVATLAAARADLTSLVNEQRVAHGLVALQVDPRVTGLAAGRAQTMAEMDTLGHAGPDGLTTFDAIRALGMTWFGAGEVVAVNSSPGEPESVGQAVTDWLASPVHSSIVLSNDYNYVGFAAAVSASGNRYYAGVFMKLPDRTPGWASASRISATPVTATDARVTLRLTGGDVPLQVLTAGLRDFEVQRRLAGGAWVAVATTARTNLSVTVARGRSYEFRVCSVDRAGNRSTWSQVSVRT